MVSGVESGLRGNEVSHPESNTYFPHLGDPRFLCKENALTLCCGNNYDNILRTNFVPGALHSTSPSLQQAHEGAREAHGNYERRDHLYHVLYVFLMFSPMPAI